MSSQSSSSAICLIRGSINIDEFYHVKRIVRPGETTSASHLEQRAGGKGANQATAVAKAGIKALLIAAVGQDGKQLVDDLGSVGVDVSGVQIVKQSTGRAVIQLAEDGENSIILFKGANYTELPSPTSSQIHPQVSHMLLQNEIPLESTLAYLSYAHRNAIKSIFNPSPMLSQAQLQMFPWEQLSWLIVNEGEVEDLLTALEPNHAPPQTTTATAKSDFEAVRIEASGLLNRLRTFMPSTNIICTLGAVGVLASYGSEIIYAPAAHLPGPPVDTTGAGDCFTGYFAAGLMQFSRDHVLSTNDVETVLLRCTQASGLCVMKRGAMESIPLAQQVDEALSRGS